MEFNRKYCTGYDPIFQPMTTIVPINVPNEVISWPAINGDSIIAARLIRNSQAFVSDIIFEINNA
jgi:hypothetical protein